MAKKSAKPEAKKLKALEKLLGQACYAGDESAVEQVLALVPEFATTAQPLLNACFAGTAPIVELLLAQGADPNVLSKTNFHFRPLHRTCEYKKTVPKHQGHEAVVKCLLAAGADPLSRGTWMLCSALATASHAGESELVRLMRATIKGDLDIFNAAAIGEEKTVTKLLKKDPTLAKKLDQSGNSALMLAANSRLWRADRSLADALISIAENLIAAGADVNAERIAGQYKMSVARFAVVHPAILKLVLKAGADPAKAVNMALWEKDFETLGLLLSAGADLTKPPLCDEPARFSHWGAWEATQWLIDNGADAMSIDKDGNTALHHAARRGANEDFIRFLLRNQADPHRENDEGDTPISLAKANKRTKLVPILESRPPRPPAKSKSPPKPAKTAEDEEFERDLPAHMRAKS